MSNILAIETSGAACSVALGDEESVCFREQQGERIHHAQLLPMIDQVLSERNMTAAQLTGIVVSIGPGSFTGVRIGVSVAQTLAFAHDIPILSLSSLWVLAQTAVVLWHFKNRVAIAVDAKLNAAYCGEYEVRLIHARWIAHPLIKDRLISFEDCFAWGRSMTLVGDAWVHPQLTLQGALLSAHTISASASVMPELARYAVSEGLAAWGAPESAQPVYLDQNLYSSSLKR